MKDMFAVIMKPLLSEHPTVVVCKYMVCSCSMLVVNKLCMGLIPLSGFVSLSQVLFAALAVALFAQVQQANKLNRFLIYVAAFTAGLYCNLKTLQSANIETVIVFRSGCPVIVAVLDWLLLGREFPSARSTMSLLGIIGGSLIYFMADSQFQTEGISAYFWCICYLLTIVFQMTYGKVITNSLQYTLSTTVFYTNALSIIPLIPVWLLKDGEKMAEVEWSQSAFLLLLLSCVLGTFISYSGWQCRQVLTATSYTVVGLVNKFGAIVINVFLWDKHASPLGLLGLSICLLSAAFYEQAPPRAILPV